MTNSQKTVATQTQTAVNTANANEPITWTNLQTISERIGLRALKTVYAKSGDDMIRRLYNGLVIDILSNENNVNENLSDGYDVASTAKMFLCEYIGKTLDATADNGEKDKDGNPVSILRACFRAVNRYIMGERQRVFKSIYIDDIENEQLLIVPFQWDIDNITDYNAVNDIIKSLNLSEREKQALNVRMRGKSLDDTAKLLGVARGSINKYMQRIRAKAEKCEKLLPFIGKMQG